MLEDKKRGKQSTVEVRLVRPKDETLWIGQDDELRRTYVAS